jgi:hypothetical protein
MTSRPDSPRSPCPECGQPRECREFRFDHEAQDSGSETAILQVLEGLGIELGAQVTVWYCAPCDGAEAVCVYPWTGPPASTSASRLRSIPPIPDSGLP